VPQFTAYTFTNIDLGNRRSDYVEIGRWQDGELVINESLLFWNNIHDTGRRVKYDYTVPISVCSQPCPINYRKQLIKVGVLLVLSMDKK
jgi:hypothetical protein